MASLNGWIFLIVGLSIGAWSWFDSSLLFFVVVGGAMALYGLIKIVFSPKKESTISKIHPTRTNPLHHQTSHAHNVTQTHNFAQNNRMPVQQSNQGHNMAHARHSSLAQPHTAFKTCPNCRTQMHVTYRFCPNCGWGV